MLAVSGFGIFLIFIIFLFILASFATRAQKKLQEQQNRIVRKTANQDRPAPQRLVNVSRPANTASKRRRRPPALPDKTGDTQPPVPASAPLKPRAPMVSLSQKRAAAAGNGSSLAKLRLNPQTLRQQYILIELIQPPLALRDDSKP